jgi:hypothetical protein
VAQVGARRRALTASLHKADVLAYNGASGYRKPLMGTRLLRASLPAILAATFGLQPAHADIYTWVDASGSINVSNLAPPDGVRVASVVHESAPAIAARAEAARQAEVQAVAERVRQLEDLELARSQAPPPLDYRAIPPPPPMIQYVVIPPPGQYADNPAPPANTGCDPGWFDCGLWGIPGFYPTSVFLLRAPNFRHIHPVRGGHASVRPPMHSPGTMRRG